MLMAGKCDGHVRPDLRVGKDIHRCAPIIGIAFDAIRYPIVRGSLETCGCGDHRKAYGFSNGEFRHICAIRYHSCLNFVRCEASELVLLRRTTVVIRCVYRQDKFGQQAWQCSSSTHNPTCKHGSYLFSLHKHT